MKRVLFFLTVLIASLFVTGFVGLSRVHPAGWCVVAAVCLMPVWLWVACEVEDRR